VPDVPGPVHKYMPSSAGCWQVFGEVQADEANRFGHTPALGHQPRHVPLQEQPVNRARSQRHVIGE
jgi:hypothetical protein